jgi:hypothetical protein
VTVKGGVRDIDRGYAEILGDLVKLSGTRPRVLVGILQDLGSETTGDGDITLAGYAAVNEFGSEDGHVPERSFLRSTIDENREQYGAELVRAVDELIAGARAGVPGAGVRRMEASLGRTGIRVSRDVQKKIREIWTPPNAPLTLERKYPGNHPLIHTGRMRQAISFMVDMTGTAEGTSSKKTLSGLSKLNAKLARKAARAKRASRSTS